MLLLDAAGTLPCSILARFLLRMACVIFWFFFINCFGEHCTGSHFHFVADQQEIRLSCQTKVRKATECIPPPLGAFIIPGIISFS